MSENGIVAITVPKWGMAMDEGTVTAWHIDEGGTVEAGDEVLDVESTKIANAIEAKQAGVLRRQVAAVGQTLPVGGLLGVIAPADVGDAEVDTFIDGFVVVAPDDDEAESGPQPQSIGVHGQTIQYLVHGEGGVPILLIHGFGGDINLWMFNQPILADTRAVYALDLPGHGGSSKDVGDGSIAFLAQATIGTIDALGLETCHLVGHSMGGAVAMQVALDHPERIASMTLIAPAGLGPEINGAYIAGYIAAERRKDMKPMVAQLFADQSLVTRQMVEDVLRAKRIDGINAALATIAAAQFDGDRQKLDLSDQAGRLDLPKQVLWGADDHIIPVSHANHLSGANVTILDGAGHMPMMEKTPDINQTIAAFVASQV
ncbi:MAG: acetoin dehydrogenase dihydrolipoyllysine-residue acetyltransferase subunit [Pseudomonadota bacterium]